MPPKLESNDSESIETGSGSASQDSSRPTHDNTQTDRLISMMTASLANLGPSKDRFKAPKFAGDTNVELFIRQFRDICEANAWNERTSLLHLRGSLDKSAVECGDEDSVEDIFQSLRACYGLTVRQARDKLANMKRAPEQSLYQLGVQIENYTRIAFSDLQAKHRNIFAMETFRRAVADTALLRHLLAVPCHTIRELVRVSEEFFQVGTGASATGSQASVTPDQNSLAAIIDRNTVAMSRLVSRDTGSDHANKNSARPTTGRLGVKTNRAGQSNCFNCGSRDHWRSECNKPAGNDGRSQ